MGIIISFEIQTDSFFRIYSSDTMKHQAAYSLLWLSGKEPSKKEVEDFMKKCGVSCDKEALDAFFKTLKDTDVKTACAAGEKKFISMPAGGGGARPAAAASGAGAKAEEKVEEKKEEEEEDVDMGGLFGDDDDY